MRLARIRSENDVSFAFLRATARALHGGSEPGPSSMASSPPSPRRFGHAAVVLHALWGRMRGGVAPRALRSLRAETIARSAIELYPRRDYRAVALGAPSGALVHLCGALGIPWLPQTVMIPVHAGRAADTPQRALQFGQRYGHCVLDHNPDWRLYQMHDPAQQAHGLARTTAFHLKRTRLGETYAAFLRAVLPPGGTIFLTECRRAWPMSRVGPRHLFQLGALGEQGQGDPDDEDFDETNLLGDWEAPPPELAPEAEWGFDPELRADVEAFARAHGYRVARILFDEPDELSPLVARLYAQWYREEGLATDRLVVEPFVNVHPRHVIRAGAVPFWMKRCGEDDAYRLEEFLDATGPWAELHLLLPRRRARSSCDAPTGRWRELLADHARDGEVLRDPRALERLLPVARQPAQMGLALLERFLDLHGAEYPVKFLEAVRLGAREEPGTRESLAGP